ncbi:MAG: Hsp20/alpha crystallin family protein [Acidimicrobiales bacterium]
MAGLMRREWPVPWTEWFGRALPEMLRGDLGDLDDWPDRDAMRLEEYLEDGTLVVKAELPGIDPERDVEITVDKGVLTIRAERREEKEEKGEGGSYRSEFRYGQFTRRLSLPAGASEQDVKATYADGILEVRVPIGEEAAGATKIPVTRG